MPDVWKQMGAVPAIVHPHRRLQHLRGQGARWSARRWKGIGGWRGRAPEAALSRVGKPVLPGLPFCGADYAASPAMPSLAAFTELSASMAKWSEATNCTSVMPKKPRMWRM